MRFIYSIFIFLTPVFLYSASCSDYATKAGCEAVNWCEWSMGRGCEGTIKPETSPHLLDVIINEVNTEKGYVELYFNENADINGWKISMNKRSGSGGTTLNECDNLTGTYNQNTFYIATDDPDLNTYGSPKFVCANVDFHSNKNEIILFDADDRVVHYLSIWSGGGSDSKLWPFTDADSFATIMDDEISGNYTSVCSLPDGDEAEGNWDVDGGCTGTPGISNNSSNNHAPVVGNTSFTVTEGTSSVGNINATDSDGHSLTYEITGGADATLDTSNVSCGIMDFACWMSYFGGSSLNNNDPLFTISNTGLIQFTFTPSYDKPVDSNKDNTYIIEVTVTDVYGSTDVETITITVLQDSVCTPVFTFTPVQNRQVNETFTTTIQAQCADGSPMTSDLTAVSIELCQSSGTCDINSSTTSLTAANSYENTADLAGDNGHKQAFIKADFDGNTTNSANFDIAPKKIEISDFSISHDSGRSFSYFRDDEHNATVSFRIGVYDYGDNPISNYNNDINYSFDITGVPSTYLLDTTINLEENITVNAANFTDGYYDVSFPINYNKNQSNQTPLNPITLTENNISITSYADDFGYVNTVNPNIGTFTKSFYYGRINPLDGSGSTNVATKVYYEVYSTSDIGTKSITGGNWYQLRPDNVIVYSGGDYDRSDNYDTDSALSVTAAGNYDNVVFRHPNVTRKIRVTVDQSARGTYLYYNPYSTNGETSFYIDFEKDFTPENTDSDLANNRGRNIKSINRLGE